MPAAFRGASTKSSVTAVSIVQREVTLLSERALLRTRTTEVATVMILTCAMRCAQRRSLRQEQELLQHHAGVALQHGSMAWTEPTITPPR